MVIVSVKELAGLIKQERKARGWTQAQLAERTGVSRDWIIGLERARPSVSLMLVLRTLKTLKLPLSIGEAGSPCHKSTGIDLDDILRRNTNPQHQTS